MGPWWNFLYKKHSTALSNALRYSIFISQMVVYVERGGAMLTILFPGANPLPYQLPVIVMQSNPHAIVPPLGQSIQSPHNEVLRLSVRYLHQLATVLKSHTSYLYKKSVEKPGGTYPWYFF